MYVNGGNTEHVNDGADKEAERVPFAVSKKANAVRASPRA